MTLINKTWLKQEVCRLWLYGESQDNIAIQLKISVGTVNSFVSEIMKSDDTIDLQRQIAIISKKNRVDIKQIAVNLKWKNQIKQSSLDDKKMENFLDVMDTYGNKYSITPSSLANQLFSIIEMTLKENVEPDKLDELLKSKINKLREIDKQIETANNMLAERKATFEEEQKRLKIRKKDLDQFHQMSNLLEIYEYPEISTQYGAVIRAIIDIKKLGYDPKIIVSKYEEFESLTKAIEKSSAKLRQFERILRQYRRKSDQEKHRWKDQGDAFAIFTRLIKDGLRVEDIFSLVHILKNDFTADNIKQLIGDIRTYGSIAASANKVQREYDAETESLF